LLRQYEVHCHAASIRGKTGSTIMENLPIQPIIAILAGILILLRPELLNYVVALYLIVIGVLGLVGSRKL